MILIVEDNLENAELLRLFLERKGGLPGMICVDGDEVIRLCRSGRVRLVIMDIQLNNTLLDHRRVTGVELTRRIKAETGAPGIPVLLTTAHAMKDQREQFLRESGAEGYFTKPVDDYDILIAEIHRWLKRSSNGLTET